MTHATRRLVLATVLAIATLQTAQAHGVKVGDLVIDHPYATPTRPGMTTGAVYFRAIKNGGTEPDKLLSAKTTVAASVELHRMSMDGNVMRMRAVTAIDLPAQSEVKVRHGGGGEADGSHHIMLQGLKAPLKDGDRFPVVLKFQRAGEREVMVWVQTPKATANDGEHRH